VPESKKKKVQILDPRVEAVIFLEMYAIHILRSTSLFRNPIWEERGSDSLNVKRSEVGYGTSPMLPFFWKTTGTSLAKSSHLLTEPGNA
jgi:hypothetical protein